MRRVGFGLVMAIMGAAILIWTWKTSNRIKNATQWPTAEARVIRSQVGRDSTRIRGGGYNHYYVPNVEYRYAVNGASYTGATFIFGVRDRLKDSIEVQRKVDVMPVGSTLRVHYNPADPAMATVEAGTVPQTITMLKWGSLLFLLAGLVAIVSGTLSIRRWIRENI